MENIERKLITLMLISISLFPGFTLAQIEVFPHRVVFEPGMRSAEVILKNTGTTPASYRMGWKDIVYDTNLNSLQINEDEGLRKTPAAQKMIRFAPRQVVIAPGESQSVRMRLRRPKGIAAGEYRSHFLFREEPDAQPRKKLKAGSSAQVSLTVGMTIPLVVRIGKGQPTLNMKQARIQPPTKRYPHGLLVMELERSGNYSIYLDTQLTFNTNDGTINALHSKGRGLYTDTDRYTVRQALRASPAAGQPLQLTLSYKQRNNEVHEFTTTVTMP